MGVPGNPVLYRKVLFCRAFSPPNFPTDTVASRPFPTAPLENVRKWCPQQSDSPRDPELPKPLRPGKRRSERSAGDCTLPITPFQHRQMALPTPTIMSAGGRKYKSRHGAPCVAGIGEGPQIRPPCSRSGIPRHCDKSCKIRGFSSPAVEPARRSIACKLCSAVCKKRGAAKTLYGIRVFRSYRGCMVEQPASDKER